MYVRTILLNLSEKLFSNVDSSLQTLIEVIFDTEGAKTDSVINSIYDKSKCYDAHPLNLLLFLNYFPKLYKTWPQKWQDFNILPVNPFSYHCKGQTVYTFCLMPHYTNVTMSWPDAN